MCQLWCVTELITIRLPFSLSRWAERFESCYVLSQVLQNVVDIAAGWWHSLAITANSVPAK